MSNCTGCVVSGFTYNGNNVTGTNINLDPSTVVGKNFHVQINNGPKWTLGSGGGVSALQLADISMYAMNGVCDGTPCSQELGCGGWFYLNALMIVPKGSVCPSGTITPSGYSTPFSPSRPPQKVNGSKNWDVYVVVFEIDLDSNCGDSNSITFDPTTRVLFNGIPANYVSGSGSIHLELSCFSCLE